MITGFLLWLGVAFSQVLNEVIANGGGANAQEFFFMVFEGIDQGG